MNKKMLVIGASKGIGRACAEYFSRDYLVTSLARSSGEIIGDICDSKTRQYLLEHCNPDVVIIAAGKISVSVQETIQLNFLAAAELITGFYNSLSEGSQIINISSIAALARTGHRNITQDRINYNTSKSAISDFCIALDQSKSRDVRVTTVEPAIVMPTDFSDRTKILIPESRYNNYNFKSFTPIQPMDIAKTVEWILNQPRHISVSRITLNNHFKKL
jgi:NADP-dependent 3-hydroxy acid dehydrogenase YdfG